MGYRAACSVGNGHVSERDHSNEGAARRRQRRGYSKLTGHALVFRSVVGVGQETRV